ncbi:MAG TPA: error-prone DNA polymerase [Solirubrobacterales bacterium]|nr:error-prone DNA polymerase [Solirubrobacterales bacterium]
MSYVELHCHSAYSFLDGASSPAELAAAAADHGHRALAITDHDGLWGAMEFAHACKGVGVRPITGVELTVEDPGRERNAFHVTLLAEDAAGYRNLCRLVTEAHRGTRPRPDREPLPPSVPLAELERRADGLVCLSGCARDGALAKGWASDDGRGAESLGRRLVAAFGKDRFRVELQRPMWRRDRSRNRWLESLAERLEVACVATGDVHAHAAARARLQDALVAVRLHARLEETEPQRRGNAASAMASSAEIAARFRDHPDAVAESGRLAERLRFDLTSDLGYRYPGSEDLGADRKLAELCRAHLDERYPRGGERVEAARRLEEELRVIRSLGLSGFFLLHRDLLELAREVAREVRGPGSARALLPPGRGRGSSVSSIVCYLTGLSHVDPVRCGLFLGRFLNEEVADAPDIDLDFPRDIRETLIPRVHGRYGPERSALVAAFATYRSRGVVRDLGKALGLPPGEIERVARSVDVHARPDDVERDVAEAIGPQRARSVRWRALLELGREAWGLPRHLSQHPGGMVLSTRPLIDICPVQPVAMEGRQAVQWDKDSCADAGFLKIDLLGLGMLSAVERCVDEVARMRGERVDLSRIPLDDPEVYATIQRAETTGVFQIESRAQMQMLRRSRPENLDDLTVQVALVRPGPIQGGAVHPYLERRRRLREDPAYEVPYDHPSLEPILADTLGAIVFQDQVIQVAMALAGFSPGEAEGLRRAMSRKRSDAALRAYRERFVSGAVDRGVAEHVAERAFDGIMGFSGFGFPKSHAAAFALLAYQSTWLRVHYGPEFLCALLNEQPMGFYPPDSLVHEAQRRGIEVRGPDVNRSGVECSVEEAAVRIGLGYVTGLREDDAAAVVGERERRGPYRDLADLPSRAGIGRDALRRLGWAGACESIAGSRRQALWRLGVVPGASRAGAGVQLALPLPVPAGPSLREQTPWEEVVAEYASVGIALENHPMKLLRPELTPVVASSAAVERVADGSPVEVAGMVVARQRPATARGVVFMLLEDELGTINVIVPPPVYERHRLIVRTASFARVSGRLERREGTTNVVASTLSPLSRPDLPVAEVRHIEPPRERETGRTERDGEGTRERRELSDLDAVLPAAHSFGRRGR